MITVFNRKELLVTMDMNKQAIVRDILSAKGIPYVIKTTNLQSSQVAGSRRGRYGSFAVNQDFSFEYKIYVHKNDYDKVAGLII